MTPNHTKVTIVGVAVKHKGRVYSLRAPNRHHNVLHTYLRRTPHHEMEEGFLDSQGNFITRHFAYLLAKGNGQLNRKPGPEHYQGPELYSEDLW